MGDANKLLQPVGAFATLLEATLTAIAAAGASDPVVVTGYEYESVAAAAAGHDVRLVHNPLFERGMGASLKAGIAAVSPGRAVMIWPADMPYIRPEIVRRLRGMLARDTIVRPVYLEQPGHPVLFGASFREQLLAIGDEEGARHVLDRNPASVALVNADDPGVINDLDTPEDFREHV